jgi:hypothetical protein
MMGYLGDLARGFEPVNYQQIQCRKQDYYSSSELSTIFRSLTNAFKIIKYLYFS